jgi:hypothetical protein
MNRKIGSLTEALRNKLLIKFWNPYDSGSTHGYVLDIGPSFFLLGLIDDSVKFNGFQCLRISDLRGLQVPDPYERFVLAALHKRNQKMKAKPNIKLDGLPELLRSANQIFPLITIHRERVRPENCWIGKVIDITKDHLFLLQIDAHAKWDENPTRFLLREITRVDFGGGYEEALHLVGGEPKKLKLRPLSK